MVSGEPRQRFAATCQLSSGGVAEVAAAAYPLLQAVGGAFAEASRLLHILLDASWQVYDHAAAVAGHSAEQQGCCCLVLPPLESEHQVSLALAKAGLAQVAATSDCAFAESCVYRGLYFVSTQLLDHKQRQQPNLQGAQAVAALLQLLPFCLQEHPPSLKSSLCCFFAGVYRSWYS